MKPKVYLAGPISGLTYDQSELWRDRFRHIVEPQIECYSPLRAKDYLRHHGVLEQSYEMHALSGDRAIMARDFWDCTRVDVVVANLIPCKRVSIGTVMEIAWAFHARRPLICIMDPENIHDHPMIREAISFRARSVEEAANLALGILLPG